MGKKGKRKQKEEPAVHNPPLPSHVEEDLSHLTISDQFLPPTKRKTLTPAGKPYFPGNLGHSVKLATNHFPLSLPPGILYQYTISVVPPWTRPYRRSDKDLYHRVVQQWRRICPPVKQRPYSWVYDGDATLYCTQPHKNIPDCKVSVMLEDKQVEFGVVDVRLVKPIPINDDIAAWAAKGQSGQTPQTALHALDVILNQSVVTNLNYTTIGRSYFRNDGHVLDIGMGKEVWTGVFARTRPHSWRKGSVSYLATLNVDVSNKAAVKQIQLLEKGDCYIQKVLGRRATNSWRDGMNKEQREIVEKDLKGLKIRYELPNGRKRQYRCNGLVESSRKQKIPDLNVTVEKYFLDTYKVKLSHPFLPCLWLGPTNKTIYIPIEMCMMMSQPMPRHKVLHEECVSQMIRHTAVPPLKRQERILKELQRNNNMYKSDPYAKEFGINIAGNMAQVTGRILPPPSIEYSQGKTVKISQQNPGKWVQRSQDNMYVEGSRLQYWAVLDLADREKDKLTESEFYSLLNGLVTVAKEVGFAISSGDNNLMYKDSSEQKVEKDFSDLVKEFNQAGTMLEMVIVILPFKGSRVYDVIKKIGDLKHKVPTQCCLKRNLFKPGGQVNWQVLSNLCLKLNSKLGGVNHVLAPKSRPQLLEVPVMILGADVTHPAPSQKGQKPSIAAIVASMDPQASQYEVEVRVQDSGQNEEVIQDMKNVVKKLLLRFNQITKKKPQALVMFRDGVSEGQFTTVMARELVDIRAACKDLQETYEPQITYIVVQKRHHTRFFPMDQNRYKNGNALAGTVVDQGINHPTEGDFFLLSHEGIQGTSRPCHYHVLWDDKLMTADELEILAYYLCHLYTRCTRSVSYPAPTYYSHLAADRARKHHDQLLEENIGKEKAKEIIESAETKLMYFV